MVNIVKWVTARTFIRKTHTTHNKKMVYETKTLELCHDLSGDGEMAYRHMLELKADELLFKSKHPVRYWLQRIWNLMQKGDSTWDGAHYSEKDKYRDGFSYVR
jgi:hypothetical protein